MSSLPSNSVKFYEKLGPFGKKIFDRVSNDFQFEIIEYKIDSNLQILMKNITYKKDMIITCSIKVGTETIIRKLIPKSKFSTGILYCFLYHENHSMNPNFQLALYKQDFNVYHIAPSFPYIRIGYRTSIKIEQKSNTEYKKNFLFDQICKIYGCSTQTFEDISKIDDMTYSKKERETTVWQFSNKKESCEWRKLLVYLSFAHDNNKIIIYLKNGTQKTIPLDFTIKFTYQQKTRKQLNIARFESKYVSFNDKTYHNLS